MTEHQEKIMLARHGTVDVALPPSAILAAAKEDFERRHRNKTRGGIDKSGAAIADLNGNWTYERYAFLVGHVRNAKSPAEILKRALAWKQSGGDLKTGTLNEKTHKLSLLHLTASVENLTLAIQLAETE